MLAFEAEREEAVHDGTRGERTTYVISRLESALVDGKKLMVVDRANLDQVRAEQGFQMSGEVDDESAKKIGGLLGAGAIVTGAFTNLVDVYGMTLKAINIEIVLVVVLYPADIAKSTRIETLRAERRRLRRNPQAPKTEHIRFTRVYGRTKELAFRIKYIPTKLPSAGNTGTFILPIERKGQSIDAPKAGGWIVLQSLDNPALSYSAERGMINVTNWNDEECWYTFKGVKAARFSLTNKWTFPASLKKLFWANRTRNKGCGFQVEFGL